MVPFRFSIWARLLLAFGFISAITILTGLIALLIFDSSNDLFATITERHLPEVVQVAEFAEIGGQIIAIAPSLISAPDESTREQISADLDNLLSRINQQISLLEIRSENLRQEVNLLVRNLKSNLVSLRKEVDERLRHEELLTQKTERLRWLYADLLDEIDPLNQDLTYNLDAEIERLIGTSLNGNTKFSALRLRSNRVAKEAIEKIGNNAVLLVSLMLQVPTTSGEEQIDHLLELSGDTVTLLRLSLKQLKETASSLTLRQLLAEIFTLAEGSDSVFPLKKKIIAEASNGERILSENRRLVTQLRDLIDEIVNKTRADAFAAVSGSKKVLSKARWVLIFMSLLSLLTAASVLWFYVRGNIVARLNSLGQSMQAIAEGDLTHEIQPVKDDEIGHMTSALKVFRGTAQAMEEANVKLRKEIQERRKVQGELVQAGKMAALGQMSTGIAHELNQPLSAIRHYLHNARLLLKRGETATHEQNLAKVIELTERMAKMINHLKTFARWPANKLSPVDLSAAIEGALALFAGRIKQEKIMVKKSYPAPGLKVLAEDIRLEQVLVNIIGNAVDAVSEENVTDKQIAIEVTEPEEGINIAIIDNGSGIKADDLELIFDPFYTTKEVGKGLGLGLSISYNIIKDFDGHIEASANDGGGTRFSITLKKAQD